MKINQVAATLFSVRNHIKTPPDIASSVKRVREIGYEAVQISGMGPIAEEELVKILDGEGLVCCATHEPTQTILDEPQAVVERLEKLKCRYTAVPSPGGIALDTMDDVRTYIERMNRAGEVLYKADKVLTYHNHHIEFRQVGGKTILEMIYAQTDPRFIQGEIDTHWVQAGGGNPVTWCAKLENRLPLLHMKDFGIDSEKNRIFEEIGYGNLEWAPIIEAADNAGTEWFIVEQDAHWADDDPFESLKLSFEFIRDNLCSK